ncbi:MAG: di-heme oxidoredictase family protein, partial [Bacteroidota bacterium]
MRSQFPEMPLESALGKSPLVLTFENQYLYKIGVTDQIPMNLHWDLLVKNVSMNRLPLHVLLFFFLTFGCRPEERYLLLYEEGEELSAENLGVNSNSANAFGFEVPGLSFGEQARFAMGNSLFNQSWVSSPASTTARDGLGPTFNARACASCHFKDGRGKPLITGAQTNGFLMRLSQTGTNEFNGPLGLPNYGSQIQDRSNRGIPIEAEIEVAYDTIVGRYPVGT